jgi:NifB/MoaA-like Fe-S oxidoreductase
VGLTKRRKGLKPLRQLTVKEARDAIELSKRWQRKFLSKFGMRVIFPSDELLLMTGTRIPGQAYYEDFPQVENGIGLIRWFLDGLKKQVKRFPSQVPKTSMSLVTGTLAAPVLQERLIPKLQRVRDLKADVITVPNRLLGDSVTVSGLLSGKDVLNTLKSQGHGDIVVLPPNIINHNSLFLDDISLSQFQRRLGVPVYIYNEDFPEILRDLSRNTTVAKSPDYRS